VPIAFLNPRILVGSIHKTTKGTKSYQTCSISNYECIVTENRFFGRDIWIKPFELISDKFISAIDQVVKDIHHFAHYKFIFI
jgi:hypothetical protein